MAIEIERKYLVADPGVVAGLTGVRMAQGYIADNGMWVRVRIAGSTGYLTLKGPSRGMSRAEFEYEIPLADAETLLAHTLALARQIAAKSPLAIAGSKLALNHARDHGVAASLQQMSLLQSAIFDTGEMATAIAAWKAKGVAEFAALGAVVSA